MRNEADWPISVRNISARLGPSQSIDKSVEALRKGKIASDTSGAAAALLPVLDVSFPLNAHPPTVTITASAPAAIQFHGTSRLGAGADITTEAEIGRFPCHASRSARISCAL